MELADVRALAAMSYPIPDFETGLYRAAHGQVPVPKARASPPAAGENFFRLMPKRNLALLESLKPQNAKNVLKTDIYLLL